MSAYAEPKMIRGSRMKIRARKIADAARLRENSMRGLQSARMMRSRTRPSEATSKKAQRSRSAHNIQKNLVRQLNQSPVCPAAWPLRQANMSRSGGGRTEERGVGREGVGTGRYRWAPVP